MKTFLFPQGISGNIFLVIASCCNFVFIWMLRPVLLTYKARQRHIAVIHGALKLYRRQRQTVLK